MGALTSLPAWLRLMHSPARMPALRAFLLRQAVLLHFLPQELDAAGLVLAVFNADPALKIHAAQNGKDAVVVVQAAANDSMLQDRSVTRLRMCFEPAQILDGPALEKAVAGVHRDYAMFHRLEQSDRIITRDDRIRGIVVYPEPPRLRNRCEQFEKDIHALCKFRILPVAVLVMVFQIQHDAAAFRIGQQRRDALGGDLHAFAPRDARPALAAQYAAKLPAQQRRHLDRASLLPKLARTLRR